MEKHKCRVCWKNCTDDQALSIHIRSHMNFSSDDRQEKPNGSEEEIESASSSEEGQDNRLYYESKKTDPEISMAMDAGSVVLQDRESETESSKNQTRRRSNRIQKHCVVADHDSKSFRFESKSRFNRSNQNQNQNSTDRLWAADLEPLSSVSDVTAEEDVAFSLMMLSRDKWITRREEEFENQEEEETMMMLTDESEDLNQYRKQSKIKIKPRASRAKYKCETCKKVFKSYQALGGHRASHKKMKSYGKVSVSVSATTEFEIENKNKNNTGSADRKVHECPVCFRVFSSGQALGGHKRSHVTGGAGAPAIAPPRNLTRSATVEKLIDLNLPAPAEEEEMSQIELSAVSDAEFAKL